MIMSSEWVWRTNFYSEALVLAGVFCLYFISSQLSSWVAAVCVCLRELVPTYRMCESICRRGADVWMCMCDCRKACVCMHVRASDSDSCKLMSSLIQRPKKRCGQTSLSESPAHRSRTHSHKNTHACNSSMHICTQPFSGTHRHLAVACGRVADLLV